MKNKYSLFSLIKNSFSYHENWQRAWRDPEPKPSYDAVIVGGGGHGLATAYYLAKEHKLNNIAVVEKGWIGGGNTGRNTTIIRSNYLWDASAGLYDHALKIWENLSQELNYNVMFNFFFYSFIISKNVVSVMSSYTKINAFIFALV